MKNTYNKIILTCVDTKKQQYTYIIYGVQYTLHINTIQVMYIIWYM